MPKEPYDLGIILGHLYTGFGLTARQKKRMEKGIELCNNLYVKQLMTTGGKGMWKKTAPSMGEIARDYLIKQGIDTTRILVEHESVNTYQNATYALQVMQQHHLTSAVVITSADHMSRAKQIFLEVFPHHYQLDFVISDYFSGIWSVIDFFWNMLGKGKRLLLHAGTNRAL
jgi:uncharacterized SAM-binding protein YcdF (DUF218 family)